MAILVLFLFLVYVLVVPHQRNMLVDLGKSQVDHELLIISNAAIEALIRKDYMIVQIFLYKWGEKNENIITVDASTPNGFMLAEYKRKAPPETETYLIKREVIYEGRHLLTIEVLADYTSVNKIIKGLNLRIYLASAIFMLVMGLTLWYSQKKIALMPMQMEITRRKEAEEKLQKAHDELENRVRERTIELKNELAVRIKAEEESKKSLAEKEVLLKEVHHRVKNNMAIISSLLRLQSSYIDDEKYMDMFKESRSRITSMALVHEKLYQTQDFSKIDLNDYILTLVQSIRNTFGRDREYNINTDVDNISLDIDILIPCGLIINEILTNSFKHAFNDREKAEINITIRRLEAGNIALTISDNGKGLPDGFDIADSTGLGLQLVNTLAEQIDGTLEIKSEKGAELKLVFPEKLEFARYVSDG